MQTTVKNWPERIPLGDYASEIDHVSRYEFASKYVQEKSVLDLACGVGYGTCLLSTKGAREVVGIDIEISALLQTHALLRQNGLKGVTFLAGSGTAIPLPSRSVEVVVSFETIEHIQLVENCLAEFARVLTEDGLLILSTPNAQVTKPVNGIPHNPYHIREYSLVELKDLLLRHFKNIELVGQQMRDTTAMKNPQRHFLYPIISLFPLRWRQSFSRIIPRFIADPIVFNVTGHNAVLRKEDMDFSAENIENAPVLVALCRKHLE